MLINHGQVESAYFFNNNPSAWAEQLQPESLTNDLWSALCAHHYNIVPLTSLHPCDVFYGEYYFRKAQNAFQDTSLGDYSEYLQQAALLDNYHAMEWLCIIALENNQYEHALYIANRAAEVYLTVGHMLQASIYYAIAETEGLVESERKRKIFNALVHLQVALKLLPSSEAALQNTHWEVSAEKIAAFQAQYLGEAQLTHQDNAQILIQAEQIANAYSA